ncbi:MAG: FkbM family methyltransferase [Myxococcota bacterium]
MDAPRPNPRPGTPSRSMVRGPHVETRASGTLPSARMERRDFLVGTLVGVGSGVAVDRVAIHLEDEARKADAQAAQATAAAATLDEPTPPGTPSKAPANIPAKAKIGDVAIGPQPPDGRQASYAQQGEDLILLNLLHSLGIRTPTYLDIGAFHPTISSNTYLFYLLGSRGVLVEPNPAMATMLRKIRPEDTVLNAGVGLGSARTAEYYLFPDRPQLNTFSKEQADEHARSGLRVERMADMPLRSVTEIIDEHFEGAPDLMSIDVEGLDLSILETMDLERTRPVTLCVETLVFGTHGVVGEIADLLRKHDYVIRGGTFVNTIFVDARRLALEHDARREL